MLARVLAVARCLSVRLCLSVTSRCSIETDTRIDLIFLARRLLSFGPTPCFKKIQVPTKIRALPSGIFFLNSGLTKFRHGISIVEIHYQLSSRKVDAQGVMNWAVVGQPS